LFSVFLIEPSDLKLVSELISRSV